MVSRETLPAGLHTFFSAINRVSEISQLAAALSQVRPYACSGFNQPLASLITLSLWQKSKQPLICIGDDQSESELFYRTLFNLINKNIFYFPEPSDSVSRVPGFTPDWERYQAELIDNISQDFSGLVFTTPSALKLPLVRTDHEAGFSMSVASKLNIGRLIETLDNWGYERVDHVYTPKSYAVRGCILDIFILSAGLPTRIELFGDEIESLRSFNPLSQRTETKLKKLEILPPPTAPSSSSISLSTALPSGFLSLFIDKNTQGYYLGTSANLKPDLINCQSTSFVRQTWEAKLEILTTAYRQFGNHLFVFADSKEQIESLDKKLPFKPQYLAAPLQKGFMLPDYRLAGYTYAELFQISSGHKQRWSALPDKAAHKQLSSLESLDWGDFLVHQDFGVGLYRGLKQIESKTATQECISIEYADGGVVYVPVDKFSRVHKYISAGDADPKLSRLGTTQWEQQKFRTRKSASAVVKELLNLYAQRSQPRGFEYQPDRELLFELETSFPYEETPDQASAIENSLNDLKQTTPMDRLICGDVGFGKTEVALRTALGVISSGYKVAFLAPTTVLADQHYLTSKSRLDPIGVRVELLSRFRTPKEQKEIIRNLSVGTIDMIVGTHRLLSADIDIPQLGLLIIDEEHRFGVRHKERIRQLKKNVDVMTLTATPIPRTLQQSLIGIRDISKIETPPKERLPIRTSIHFFNWEVMVAAIELELNRAGQVFFLQNNIETLPFYQEKIRSFFPDKNVAIAHGQMSSRLLESTMLAFFSAEIDILICTTIIESGLDIANANTVIINDSHRFGLAQIYQIRGRVGRSNRQAYCLLVIPKNIKLTKNAYQRLKAIEYFSNLGAGYDIALKDLEIRGAGNLFGFEQSGQIATVGFEMYCKILKDAVDEAVGNLKTDRRESSQVVFGGDALFPATYMNIVQDRLFFYQRLADADAPQAIKKISAELRDRFGPLPDAVNNLIYVTQLRVRSLGSGLQVINIQTDSIMGTVSDKTRFHNSVEMMSELETLLKKSSRHYLFSVDKKNNLRFEIQLPSLSKSMTMASSIVELFSPLPEK